MSKTPEDQIIRGHDADGIEEYDNPLPRWWTALFLVTVVFSAFYFIYMHMGGGGRSVVAEYAAEEAEARAARPPLEPIVADEATLAAAYADPARTAAGKAIYDSRCQSCHGAQGQGGVGPNLTDDSWINTGGTLQGMFDTIRDGVPAKGMIAWGAGERPTLGRDEIVAVTAYVATLYGTKPAGAKDPQGQKTPKVSWK
ncbi:MAG: c-type cytochrome [Polyangiaceae bacterium]|nr:c-type cytochrome [Polyangiaceae bacterium]